MPDSPYTSSKLVSDLSAGLVVFLVALPLCLGVALASKADPMSGLLSGIVGGLVVGLLSGSHTSITGPSPGMIAVVAAQIALFPTFETFLLALFVCGLIQIGLGIIHAGFVSAFFPSSVVKGLLAAIGVLLILKQVPHVLGHDDDPSGDLGFEQHDKENTFTAFEALLGDVHAGAAVIGVLAVLLLFLWDRSKTLKSSKIPAPLVVVALGIFLNWLFGVAMESLDIPPEISLHVPPEHLVDVPIAKTINEFFGFLRTPNFAAWNNPVVYSAALSMAIVASLESLLNLAALDKIDPLQRVSPANRELVVQGIGNCVLGLIGGIPASAVIVRGSVNVSAGAKSKVSAIVHGALIAVCVIFLPQLLNKIPLSCLAAILLVTGAKLASPALVKRMWDEGRYQFIPFMATMVAIILTDLLKGIVFGMVVSVTFILSSNLRKPVRRVVEKHLGGDVLHIQFASQVSFLNRAALEKILRDLPRGSQVLLDASNTDYIDPDVLDLIRDFKEQIAPAHGVIVSVRGFRHRYHLQDDIQYVDYSTRELQDQLTAAQVLQILKDGNERFRTDKRLTRDLGRQIGATAKGQHPLAVILSCIDSRNPAEIILDLGIGDIFSVRIAGNVISENVLGSMEYGCAVAGAKVILVMGHTCCGAVTAAVELLSSGLNPEQTTGCQHLEAIVGQIQQSLDGPTAERMVRATGDDKTDIVNIVAKNNVLRMVREIVAQSRTIRKLVNEGRIAVVGAMYDVRSGKLNLLEDENGEKAHSHPARQVGRAGSSAST
jgi:carbonic anhydrase/SulP family sulfate permease